MDAANLTSFQKKQLKQTVKEGKSLPLSVHPSNSSSSVVFNHNLTLNFPKSGPNDEKKNYNQEDIFKLEKKYFSTKKKLETMKKEGLFETPQAPTSQTHLVDRDKEKEKLNLIFEFGDFKPKNMDKVFLMLNLFFYF